MKLVIVESPYAGDVEANTLYARACLRDCLERGEAPLASHLLYTQPGVLDDAVDHDRSLGIAAGIAWQEHADVVAVYMDRGLSNGMKLGILAAELHPRIKVEYRTLTERTDAEREADRRFGQPNYGHEGEDEHVFGTVAPGKLRGYQAPVDYAGPEARIASTLTSEQRVAVGLAMADGNQPLVNEIVSENRQVGKAAELGMGYGNPDHPGLDTVDPKGPWHHEKDQGKAQGLYDPSGTFLGRISEQYADLAAAAPRMLELLREFCDAWDDDSDRTSRQLYTVREEIGELLNTLNKYR